MNYKGKLKTGEEILLKNDGMLTLVQLQSGDSTGRRSQSTSFETGPWADKPHLFTTMVAAYLKIEGQEGTVFLEVKSEGIQRLDEEPELENSESLELETTEENPASVEFKPMAPMKPLKGFE